MSALPVPTFAPKSVSRPFEVGTLGWSQRDFVDPAFVAAWEAGRFEIIEGVLTKMPPPSYSGGVKLFRLLAQIDEHLRRSGGRHEVGQEIDVVLGTDRVVRADGIVMLEDQIRKQAEGIAARGETAATARLRVPPHLIIECVSVGHESHDRRTKRAWYADFAVPHYWIFDPAQRSVECLLLEGGAFVSEGVFSGEQSLTSKALPGLSIALTGLWRD